LFFTFGFLVLFILCSITGVILINASLKNPFSINSYIVYTFYYTLLMSFVFAMFSAFYGWLSPQCHFKEWNGIVHFITLFTGANLMFFSYYFLGLAGMPGLINEHPAVFEFWNVFDSLGFSISLISTIWFFYIVFKILLNKYFL
jgi:cytochrome c oxidase subunit 1